MPSPTKIEIINTFAISLLRQNSLDDLLWSMAENIGTLLGFEDCVIYLKRGERLVQMAAFGVKNPAPRDIKNRIELGLGEGIVGCVAESAHPELIADVSTDARYIFDEFSGRAELSVPLLYAGEVLGVIDSESSRVNGFTHHHLDMLTTLANIAAPRIASAMSLQEKQQAEQALVAARNDAERANRAKSEFLSHMSHELRTPLNAILGFAQLLELDAEDFSDAHADSIGEILHAGRHLLDLINEILDLTKIESGRLEFSPRLVRIEPMIEECLALTTSLAEQRSIMMTRGPMADFTVHADPVRLKQALLNLISNAIKYNRKGGAVVVEARQREGMLRVEVIDSGPGIALERQAELFQPFNRLNADSSDVEGTGIGLALTRRIIEAMQGQVGVVSGAGKGSTFWFELPLENAGLLRDESRDELPAARA